MCNTVEWFRRSIVQNSASEWFRREAEKLSVFCLYEAVPIVESLSRLQPPSARERSPEPFVPQSLRQYSPADSESDDEVEEFVVTGFSTERKEKTT